MHYILSKSTRCYGNIQCLTVCYGNIQCLTVFRDQHFSQDMTSEAVKRIEDVNIVQSSQFVQNAGPKAHPIRPESCVDMDKFYTVTVYSKSTEVI